jgi:hypothetical protein
VKSARQEFSCRMNILIHCPSPLMREAISRHLVDVGNHQLFFAETEPLTVSIALHNEIPRFTWKPNP